MAITEQDFRDMAVDVGVTKAKVEELKVGVASLEGKVEKLAKCVAENKVTVSRIVAWGAGFAAAAGLMYALIRYLAIGVP